MAKSPRREFDSVDRSKNPSDFIAYLDAVRHTDFFQEIKRQTIAAMELHPGDVAVDVGCGTGEDVTAMALQVAPKGRAIGIDNSAAMVTTAQQRAHAQRSAAVFVQADASSLPLEDTSVDAVRAERLLQHTSKPEAALREMLRVLKRGGRLVIWEGDLDLFVIDAPDYEVSRVLQRFVCDQFLNGAIGHRLYGMFVAGGLTQVRSQPMLLPIFNLELVESAFDLSACLEVAVSRGLLERDRAQRWLESLRSAASAGRFFSAVGGFITFGRKDT